MLRRARSLAVLAVATAALAAGCSGGEPTAQSTPVQSASADQSSAAQPSSPAEPSSAAPSSTDPTETPTAAAPSTAPSTTAPSTTASKTQSSDQAGTKPSKSDIVAGLTVFYEKNQNIPPAKAKKFAVCMVDQMYSKAKASTLRAMRDGDPSKIDKGDAGLIGQAGLACQPALG